MTALPSKQVYERREDMPARYRDTLEQMMRSQAYRELAAARLFGNGLQFVEGSKWLKFIVWHIGEETEHYLAVGRMYEKFSGQSVDAWVSERLTQKPIPFAQSWFELAMAQFLYDRGGFWQLQEYDGCSYPPYREVIGQIIDEERGHQALGEKIVIELSQSGRYQDCQQALFERWLRLGLLSFGRPQTEGNRYAIEVGLKKRDSGEVMQDFINDIKPAVRASSLSFPDPESLKLELPSWLDWTI